MGGLREWPHRKHRVLSELELRGEVGGWLNLGSPFFFMTPCGLAEPSPMPLDALLWGDQRVHTTGSPLLEFVFLLGLRSWCPLALLPSLVRSCTFHKSG